jgi:hypothetical protein
LSGRRNDYGEAEGGGDGTELKGNEKHIRDLMEGE